jgi:divalent metal cation (Fe/Co/Zn/Cd) transporter
MAIRCASRIANFASRPEKKMTCGRRFKEAKIPAHSQFCSRTRPLFWACLVAFLGILFGHLLNLPWLDGAASICIGLILVVTAILMAVEIKGLLIGEGARSGTLNKICELVQSDPAVERARRPLTMYLGPETALLALDIQFRKTLSAGQVAEAVDRIERSVRQPYPRVRHIYIEAEAFISLSSQPADRDLDEPVPVNELSR